MAAANVLTISGSNFQEEVVKSPTPVLVDFWAEWCGPCKMLGPTIDELASDYGPKVKFGKVDVDQERDLALQFNVQSIPTILFFKGGQVAGQIIGSAPKKKLKDALDKLLV